MQILTIPGQKQKTFSQAENEKEEAIIGAGLSTTHWLRIKQIESLSKSISQLIQGMHSLRLKHWNRTKSGDLMASLQVSDTKKN